EKQAPNCKQLMIELAIETPSGKLDQVIRQRTRQIRACTYVGNDFEPGPNVSNGSAAECARDVQVFTARLAAQWCGDEGAIRNRSRQDRRHQDEVTKNHAWPGERPGLAGNFEDARADQNSDQRRVRFNRAQVAAQAADDRRGAIGWNIQQTPSS